MSQKRHKPANGTEIAQDPKTQIRPSAVQGLLLGSSSSVMLRLVGHGVVSEKNNAGEVCRAALHFVVEMKRGLRRFGLFTLLISNAVCGLSLRLVKFKLLIAAICNASGLL